ncbi:MAG: MFS transporter [Clostridia bacterium]|nr:MFS transporter [Clostridia bacterium]
MQRNIKLFPVYKLFSYDILFYYAVSILFLTGVKGFSLSQTALLSSIYSFAAIISQIPASIVADKIGLRNSMIVGNLLIMIWALFYLAVPSFSIIIIGEACCAFGFALKGTSESPFLYSTLKKAGKTSEFSKVEGKGSSLYFVVEAVASIAAGYLYFINPYLPMIFSAICALIATVLAFYMKSIKTSEKDKLTTKERFSEMIGGFKFIFKSKRLHALLIFACVFCGILSLSNLYIKTFLNDIQVSSTLFGYIFAISSIASAVGSAVQDKIEKKHKNKTLTTISITYIVSFVVIGAFALIFKNYNILLTVGLIVFLVQSLIKGAYRIIMKEYVSRYTTSKIRSKLMSIYYLAESFGSTILMFIASKTIDLVPIGVSYCVFGLALFIVTILILNYMNSRVGLDPATYSKNDRMDLQEE